MAGSNSESKNYEFYSLKAKVDESNEPYFGQTEKVEGKWKETKRFDTMNGVIVGAFIDEKEFKPGEGKKKFFVLLMEENGTIAKVAMTHNQVAYGIINSIASCVDKLSKFSIKVYRDKPTTGDNGKTYYNGKSFVKKENNKTEWHVRMQDAPKKEPVMLAGGVQYKTPDGKLVFDSTKVQAFWENIFTIAIVGKVGTGKPTAPAAEATQNNTAAATNTFVPQSQEDDLPF
jgi:hypothetical protein